MLPKTSPETSGAMDEVIAALERYSIYALPLGAVIPRRTPKVVPLKGNTPLAGAA